MSRAVRRWQWQSMRPTGRRRALFAWRADSLEGKPDPTASTQTPGFSSRLGGLAETDDAHAALQQALHQVVRGGIGVAAGQDGARVLGAARAVRGCQHVQQREQRLRLSGARRALRGRTRASAPPSLRRGAAIAGRHACSAPPPLCLWPPPQARAPAPLRRRRRGRPRAVRGMHGHACVAIWCYPLAPQGHRAASRVLAPPLRASCLPPAASQRVAPIGWMPGVRAPRLPERERARDGLGNGLALRAVQVALRLQQPARRRAPRHLPAPPRRAARCRVHCARRASR